MLDVLKEQNVSQTDENEEFIKIISSYKKQYTPQNIREEIGSSGRLLILARSIFENLKEEPAFSCLLERNIQVENTSLVEFFECLLDYDQFSLLNFSQVINQTLKISFAEFFLFKQSTQKTLDSILSQQEHEELMLPRIIEAIERARNIFILECKPSRQIQLQFPLEFKKLLAENLSLNCHLEFIDSFQKNVYQNDLKKAQKQKQRNNVEHISIPSSSKQQKMYQISNHLQNLNRDRQNNSIHISENLTNQLQQLQLDSKMKIQIPNILFNSTTKQNILRVSTQNQVYYNKKQEDQEEKTQIKISNHKISFEITQQEKRHQNTLFFQDLATLILEKGISDLRNELVNFFKKLDNDILDFISKSLTETMETNFNQFTILDKDHICEIQGRLFKLRMSLNLEYISKYRNQDFISSLEMNFAIIMLNSLNPQFKSVIIKYIPIFSYIVNSYMCVCDVFSYADLNFYLGQIDKGSLSFSIFIQSMQQALNLTLPNNILCLIDLLSIFQV